MAIKIIGTGSYLPENVADNHFLSTIVDTNDEWISQRTGIKERRLSSGSKEGTTYMATQAALSAMEDAGVTPEQVTYINAHGTSTSLNDKGETAAVKLAFKDAAKNVMMSSTKSMTGHLLGASGAVEAMITALSVSNDYVPATIHYEVPDENCDLDIVPNEGRHTKVDCAMSNSLGFGGHNATLVFKKI